MSQSLRSEKLKALGGFYYAFARVVEGKKHIRDKNQKFTE